MLLRSENHALHSTLSKNALWVDRNNHIMEILSIFNPVDSIHKSIAQSTACVKCLFISQVCQ